MGGRELLGFPVVAQHIHGDGDEQDQATDVCTVEELRKQYRQLMKKHHPDVGGSTEDAKQINAEYDGVFLRITNKSLPMGGRRKTEYKKMQAARVPKGESIEDRPVEVATREEPFHWEMDSVLSAKEGGSKKRFLTITERTSRADLMFLMPDGTMASVVAVLDMLEKKLGSFNFRRIFQTITVDNGSEFQDWEGMTRAVTGEGARTHIYYCHPYSAFERGSNENGNRMIRRRVPKGTDFTEITEEDTLQVQRWVNEYPRGILGGGGRCAGRVLLELAQGAGIEGAELLL